MAEPFDRLSAAFTDLAVSVLPEVTLPGPDAAQASVRQRRRRRLSGIAAAVAILILTPAGAITLLRGSPGQPPDIGNTPTPPATASPSPIPSPPASQQPASLRVIADGNARESTPLDDALLPIPSFEDDAAGCPAGETQYADGVWQGAEIAPDTHVESRIYAVTTGDVNGDGTLDWVAGISCVYGVAQPLGDTQIVAFTRHGAGPYEILGPLILADPIPLVV
jgi:hypothetical protein